MRKQLPSYKFLLPSRQKRVRQTSFSRFSLFSVIPAENSLGPFPPLKFPTAILWACSVFTQSSNLPKQFLKLTSSAKPFSITQWGSNDPLLWPAEIWEDMLPLLHLLTSALNTHVISMWRSNSGSKTWLLIGITLCRLLSPILEFQNHSLWDRSSQMHGFHKSTRASGLEVNDIRF